MLFVVKLAMTISSSIKPKEQSLYDADYVQWIEATIQKLQQKDYESVDWENLLDEIAAVGRSEKRRLKSNLIVVLLHLLKWQYHPDGRMRSWASSIVEHRRRVVEALETSPSLKSSLEDVLASSYTHAIKQASVETGIARSAFPEDCPYTVSQALDDDFMPE